MSRLAEKVVYALVVVPGIVGLFAGLLWAVDEAVAWRQDVPSLSAWWALGFAVAGVETALCWLLSRLGVVEWS